MKIKVTNIVYDTGDESDLDLPTEMIVNVDGVIDIESFLLKKKDSGTRHGARFLRVQNIRGARGEVPGVFLKTRVFETRVFENAPFRVSERASVKGPDVLP